MTAVEWLIKELNLEGYDYTIEQAKQMEKQQIIDAFELWRTGSGEQYYNETYGSKGSNERIVDTNKTINSQSEISDELSFNKKLEKLINIHSMENESNTPDFILAKFMSECLQSFNNAVKHREQLKSK